MSAEAQHDRREQRVDRLARRGLLLVIGAAVAAVAAGAVAAVTWQPSEDTTSYVDPCPNPPCFGTGGLPSGADVLVVLPVFALLLAAALGLPGLLLTASRVVRRRARRRRRVLPFAGPLLVLVLMEVVPHLLNPASSRTRSGTGSRRDAREVRKGSTSRIDGTASITRSSEASRLPWVTGRSCAGVDPISRSAEGGRAPARQCVVRAGRPP